MIVADEVGEPVGSLVEVRADDLSAPDDPCGASTFEFVCLGLGEFRMSDTASYIR
jgi:hypothetical protein